MTAYSYNHIQIPNPIVDTLGFKEGEPFTIILDTQEECIKIIKMDSVQKDTNDSN